MFKRSIQCPVSKHPQYTKRDVMTTATMKTAVFTRINICPVLDRNRVSHPDKTCKNTDTDILMFMFWHRWLKDKMLLNCVTSRGSRIRAGLNFIANVLLLISRPPCVSTRVHKCQAKGHPCDYILEGIAHIFGSWVQNLLHVTLPASRNYGWLLDFGNFVQYCTS